MSDQLGTYSFLPWLRQGIAGQITSPDHDTTVIGRASVHVKLQVSGEPLAGGAPQTADVDRDVQLYGPGDVVGLDPRAIVRLEPRDWITNYEPNFMPHVEFYDEDLPWRYTPAAPDGARLHLRPWLCLAVLAEDEFVDGRNVAGKPLPYIDVTDPKVLPDPDELWAWAHVHVNRTLAGGPAEFTSTDMAAVLPRLRAVLDENPDLAFSRLVCPRHLKPNTAYHAFLIPTFESGRLAGVGLDPAGATHASQSAWRTNSSPGSLPYYFRWYFHAGSQGDFEYLVRLLEPRPVDKRVGVRDVDVRAPGSNIPGITDADLHGVLKLGGALRVPRSSFTKDELKIIDRYEDWAHEPVPPPADPPNLDPNPHPFQVALAHFANLPDDYEAKAPKDANDATGLSGVAGDPDPLITAPVYARWHALTTRLLVARDGTTPVDHDRNWVHELNLDPRHRLAAGFGTNVVQARQEDYVQAAWEQVGDVLAANRRIRFAQLALETSAVWYAKQLQPLAVAHPERALVLTTPVQSHVLGSATTVRHQRNLSLVPEVLTSAPMRRVARPRGRLMRALPFDDRVRPDNLVARVNAGEASPAPPKVTPPAVVTTDELADLLLPTDAPPWVVKLLTRRPWLPWLVLALALVVLIVAIVLGLIAGVAVLIAGVVVAAVLLGIWWLLARWSRRIASAGVIRPGALTPQAVDQLPKSPDFVITEPSTTATPPTIGTTDSPQGGRFKGALGVWGGLHAASAAAQATQPVPGPVSIAGLAGKAVAALNPAAAIPKRTLAGIEIPGRIAGQLDDADFGEVMAYPEIDVPMYEPLKKLSDELFLPNLNLIPQNTITLLETNQKFIEAYMVGLNHELGRELLWREYPTDQRGSYFRQFWDARGALTTPGLTAEQRKELLRDIPPINRWQRSSVLGDHDHREKPGAKEEEVVLVIRGELLKKYPNAVIYAQHARWQMLDNRPDPSQERELDQPLPPPEDPAFNDFVRTPLYEARVDPDITFFGFDLTVVEARGDSGEHVGDRPGWFFVIKERPGEPRFGFDLEREGEIQTVNDLAWPDTGAAEGGFVAAGALATITLKPLGTADHEKIDQRADDLNVVGAPVSAARWAYLLYQAPVMVAVHATEMLTDPDG